MLTLPMLKYIAWTITAALGIAAWRWRFTADDPVNISNKLLTPAGRVGLPLLVLSSLATVGSMIADERSSRAARTDAELRARAAQTDADVQRRELAIMSKNIEILLSRPSVEDARKLDPELDHALTEIAPVRLLAEASVTPNSIRLPGVVTVEFRARTVRGSGEFEVSYRLNAGGSLDFKQLDGSLTKQISTATTISTIGSVVRQQLSIVGTDTDLIAANIFVEVRTADTGLTVAESFVSVLIAGVE